MNAIPFDLQGVFDVNPKRGSLEALDDEQVLKFTFNPIEKNDYDVKLPIYIDSNPDKPY
jgi:hypothetical protein